MNDIIKAMETRRSIRGYKEDMVPEELIAEVDQIKNGPIWNLCGYRNGQAVTDYTCSYQ